MDLVYRKGLTVGDAKNREFKVYEPIKKYDIVEKIIIQFKKSKMKNDYGVYKGNIEAGTDEWLVQEMPLELGSAINAIDHYSMSEAITIANYLTQTEGETYSFGRPNDRHGS